MGREPLFKDFCQTIPQRYGGQVNIYNTGTLDTIKTDFKAMVEDKWNRSQLQDPSVEMNFGAKVYAWRDMHVKKKFQPLPEFIGNSVHAPERQPLLLHQEFTFTT